MRHETCRKNLSAYYDGELREDERHALEEHLAACPECRAELEQLRSVSGLVKKHVMEPVPPSLKGAVMAPRRAPRPWLKPVLALSAAAAGLLVVFNIIQPDDEAAFMSSGFASRDGGSLYSVDTFSPEEAAPRKAAPASGGAGVFAGASSGLVAEKKAAPGLEEADGAPAAPAETEGIAVASRKMRASSFSAAAAARGAMEKEESAEALAGAALSEKPAAAQEPCFCISPARTGGSPYSIMRLPGTRCAGDVFRPREDSAASAYLPTCPPGLPPENAVKLEEACFCVNHTPDKLPPYSIGRISSPDCAYVRFKPRQGAAAPSYLPDCSR